MKLRAACAFVALSVLACGQSSPRPDSASSQGGAAASGSSSAGSTGQAGGATSGGDGGASGGSGAKPNGYGGSGASGGSVQNAPECAGGGFAWPDGAKAAVSLTYDDGMPSQLANAAPVLERHGLVATFFLSENYAGFEMRKAAYAELVSMGFEMAPHTVKHPCFGLTPDLSSYDAETLGGELDQNIATIRALGMTGALTFAYPCGNREYGQPPASYVPLIEERFLAARGVNCCAQTPAAVDLFNVNTNWPAEDAKPEDVTPLVDQAVEGGTWLVFGFHAVGEAPGEWSAVPQPAHDALAAHLAAKGTELWVGTFGEVADYVKRCR